MSIEVASAPYECAKHGPYGPARFCCACTRERVEAERDGLRRELANTRSAIWAFFQLRDSGRTAQADGMLRSALPDDYRPVGA